MAVERERALWANLCHDLKTPLNLILGYSAMLIEDTESLPAWSGRTFELRRTHEAGARLLALLGDAPRARRLDGAGESFAATAAWMRRELRGPIDAVVGCTDRLLASLGEPDEGQAIVVDLRRIRAAALRFTAQLDDFFTAHEIPPEPVVDGVASLRPSPSFLPAPEIRRSDSERADPTVSSAGGGTLLVVDDNDGNRDVLMRRLSRQGHKVSVAPSGAHALELLRRERFDMVLLDVMMPEMDGYQVLERMKSDEALRHIPVIMISARGDMDSVVRCIELGAEDYLAKPFNPVLLRARIGAALGQKRLRDRERVYLEQLRVAQEQSETLLLNVLPKVIVDRLKQGETSIADHFQEVTVLFADIVGFTAYASRLSPATVVERLNDIFSVFDELAQRHGVEKIKTIGDGYLAVGGLPVARADHAQAIAELALDMQAELSGFNQRTGETLVIRTGIHSGPVVAGIIGTKRFSYDLWGDTVNTASRMESHGLPGAIQISEATWRLLEGKYAIAPRGIIEVKGKGRMATWVLTGRL